MLITFRMLTTFRNIFKWFKRDFYSILFMHIDCVEEKTMKNKLEGLFLSNIWL